MVSSLDLILRLVGLATEKLHHVKDFLQDHMDTLQLALQNVPQAQDRYKKYADEKQRQVVFNKGDCVLTHGGCLPYYLSHGPGLSVPYVYV